MTDDIRQPIPVILDTDLGDDIDDTWAIALMLKCPELDVRLITTDWANTTARARILAKLLEAAGRTDIPIGIGLHLSETIGAQAAWAEDYDVERYPGAIHQDGVQALIDTIMGSPERITLICIGPNPNIAEALKREPAIAEKARFVGMYGSVRKGYLGSAETSAEWNVKSDAQSCRRVFEAAWDMTITPVDTCGLVVLRGEKYRAVRDSTDPLVQALIAGFRTWARNRKEPDPERQSSVLFDTVAVYLAFTDELLHMERLGIRVTDDGFTVIDDGAKHMDCAMEWKDLPAFEDFLVERLTGAVARK